jgi:hypothetical protein
MLGKFFDQPQAVYVFAPGMIQDMKFDKPKKEIAR